MTTSKSSDAMTGEPPAKPAAKSVVLIHGAFAGGWCFEKFAGFLRARGWICHTPDLRYHGVGPRLDPDPRLAETSIRDFTADMVAYIEQFAEPPVIVGHSMGGLIAQQLAAKGLARALVLLGAGAPSGVLPSSEDELAVAARLMSLGAFWTTAIHADFDMAAGNSLNKVPAQEQRSIFDKFCPESGLALFELLFWMFDRQGAAAVDVEKIACPVLCMSGAEDKVISPETGRRIAEKYAAVSEFDEAPGHGHFLLLEPGWERLAERCETWMSRVAVG